MKRNSKPARRPRSQAGFSLTELMVTVSILLILSGVAVPIYLNQRTKAIIATAKSDGQQLVSEISTQLMGKSGSIARDTGVGPTHTGNVLITGGTDASTYDAGLRLSDGTTVTSAGGVTQADTRGVWCVAVTNRDQTVFFNQDGYQSNKTSCDESPTSPTYGQLLGS